MRTIFYIIFIATLVGAIGLIFFGTIGDRPELVGSGENVDIRDGVQYVTVRAKGGYSPKISSVQSGIPTKLIVKTDNTYDCSASLVIPSIKFKKILQPTGQEVIDLGVLQSGKTIQVLCSMGMYSFQIRVM